jgi:four helix bundle protein
MEEQKIKSFKDLKTWQIGHQLVLAVYECTKKLPREEIFGLYSQLRRASVSVTSNIAEGFSRRTKKEKAQFYYQSNGSLSEIKNQLLIARDLGYIEKLKYEEILNITNHCQALLQGLIKSCFSKVS